MLPSACVCSSARIKAKPTFLCGRRCQGHRSLNRAWGQWLRKRGASLSLRCQLQVSKIDIHSARRMSYCHSHTVAPSPTASCVTHLAVSIRIRRLEAGPGFQEHEGQGGNNIPLENQWWCPTRSTLQTPKSLQAQLQILQLLVSLKVLTRERQAALHTSAASACFPAHL